MKTSLKILLGVVALIALLTGVELSLLGRKKVSYGTAQRLSLPPPDTIVELPPPPPAPARK